jgi:hypothetical protein
MNKSKIISTLSYLINFGISSERYYSTSSLSKLKDAKSFWDGDYLCFRIGDKVHKLKYEGVYEFQDHATK